MFQLRGPSSRIANEIETSRQSTIWAVVRHSKRLKFTTLIEKKAAAIMYHPYINPILKSKIYKILNDVRALYNNDEELNLPTVKESILKLTQTVQLGINDTISLPIRPSLFAYRPLSMMAKQQQPLNTDTDRGLFVYDAVPISRVTMSEFERLCFDNRVLFQYYRDTNFSSYVYQNILHSLNAQSVDHLMGNLKWQASFAFLIDATNFSDFVTKTAFYNDTILYNGLVYDTSFVPNYDVNALEPIDPLPDIECLLTQKSLDCIEYHENLNPRIVTRVPDEYVTIFLTFPFKASHYIDPQGKITYIDMNDVNKYSVRYRIEYICSVSDIEGAINDASRIVLLEDVIAYALNAANINAQGAALLIIRQMVGVTLKLGGFKIVLPTINQVLDWSSLRCSPNNILLPLINTARRRATTTPTNIPVYASLVKDIASSCVTALGATFLCSSYHIPESDLRGVFELLETDAEVYVFLTLLMQQYNTNAYKKYRDRLSPVFGTSPIPFIIEYYYDIQPDNKMIGSKYPQHVSPFLNTTTQERLNSYTQRLVQPTDNNATTSCPPYQCTEMYRFTDPQLDDLVTNGDTVLDDFQYASFVSLFLHDVVATQ